jgi:cysteine-rich repeat protein
MQRIDGKGHNGAPVEFGGRLSVLALGQRLALGLVAAVCAAGCEGSGGTTTVDDPNLPGSASNAGDGSAASGSATGTEPQDTCGDGTVASDEECDDGNRDDLDGCSRLCLSEVCGNGRLDALETCDPPGEAGCDSTCGSQGDAGGTAMVCGNNVVEAGEQCDDGNTLSGDGCDALCGQEPCGDGEKDESEACDDGNNIDNDGCESDCTITDLKLKNPCGNGKEETVAENPALEEDEQCDDGNLVAGDGCSGICTIETKCGDGVVAGTEQCDDPADPFCSGLCTVIHRCGNGVTTGNEACDDGNDVDGDGCTGCRVDGECGNGILDWDEQCEGSQGIAEGGYCDPARCTRHAGPGCGNGQRDTGESCDDGNRRDGDGCAGDCTLETCGNGKVEEEAEEWCDFGPEGGEGLGTCFPVNFCGDGSRSAEEECDDHNATEGDGCSEVCLVEELCGDGIINGTEPCDDGNATAGDGCTRTCTPEGVCTCSLDVACGDGTVNQPSEQCDDGNLVNGDGCSSRCYNEAPVSGGGGSGGGCSSSDFDTHISCWAPFDTDSMAVRSTQDVANDAASGSLAVAYTFQLSSSALGSGGVRNCVPVLGSTPYSFAASYLIDANQSASTYANVGVFGYDSPDCNGAPQNLYVSTAGAAPSGWGMFASQFTTTASQRSVQLRLNVAKRFDEPARTVLFDGVQLTGPMPTVPVMGCGDGVLGTGETCDDGNNEDGDGCNAACQNENVCGDGVLLVDTEDCDDGNLEPNDGCSVLCKPEALCGDGQKNGAMEECDGGAGCTASCRLSNGYCGDGMVQAQEACDSGPSCDPECTATCTFAPRCGDGVRTGAELLLGRCDDGNLNDNDGCSARCFEEICGDGIAQGAVGCTPTETSGGICEVCDDHGPSATCTIDCKLVDPVNGACPACEAKACTAEATACDDLTGLTESGPGAGIPRAALCRQLVSCAADYGCTGMDCYCASDFAGGCAAEPGPCRALMERAGESVQEAKLREELIDSTSTLHIANDLITCRKSSCDAPCKGVCGNGRVDGDEACDSLAFADPNVTSVEYCDGEETSGVGCGQFCTRSCELAICGDGVVAVGLEACDGEPDCAEDCTLIAAQCGDGIISDTSPNEENCETIGPEATVTCDATCCRTRPVCGNGGTPEEGCGGVKEACDDGNTTNGDGCDASCNIEASGCMACLLTEGYYGCASQREACYNGPALEASDGKGLGVLAEDARTECKEVYECMFDPSKDIPRGRVCGAYGQLSICVFGFQHGANNVPVPPETEGAVDYDGNTLNDYILNRNPIPADWQGTCKDEIQGAVRGVTGALSIAQTLFDEAFPAGRAGMLAYCTATVCAEQCGVTRAPF